MMRIFKSAAAAAKVVGLLTVGAALLCAQKPKGPKEIEGLMSIQNAATADAKMKAVDDFLAKFADTEFKSIVLEIAADAAERSNQYEKMVLYAERALEANPKSYMSMLQLARGLATHTREFDLDKEEKLSKAEKYANSAIEISKNAPKLRPEIPDDQWASAKKDFEAQGHEALALSAMVRKKFDMAANEFGMALNMAPQKDPAIMVRLGAALTSAGKPEEGIKVLEQAIAFPGSSDQVKQIAQSEISRAKATKK